MTKSRFLKKSGLYKKTCQTTKAVAVELTFLCYTWQILTLLDLSFKVLRACNCHAIRKLTLSELVLVAKVFSKTLQLTKASRL